jgi:hypothetical protein
VNSRRFIVTAVILLGISALAACKASHEHPDVAKQGQQQLNEAATIEQDLATRYSIHLQSLRDANGKVTATSKELARDFNWSRLSKEERQEIKSKLSRYIDLLDGVLKLDGSRKGVYVTFKEVVVRKRAVAAMFRQSAEHFEKMVGADFQPKADGSDQPAYVKTIGI